MARVSSGGVAVVGDHAGEVGAVGVEGVGHAEGLQGVGEAGGGVELPFRQVEVDAGPGEGVDGVLQGAGVERCLDGVELALVREDDRHAEAGGGVREVDDLHAVEGGVGERLGLAHEGHVDGGAVERVEGLVGGVLLVEGVLPGAVEPDGVGEDEAGERGDGAFGDDVLDAALGPLFHPGVDVVAGGVGLVPEVFELDAGAVGGVQRVDEGGVKREGLLAEEGVRDAEAAFGGAAIGVGFLVAAVEEIGGEGGEGLCRVSAGTVKPRVVAIWVAVSPRAPAEVMARARAML